MEKKREPGKRVKTVLWFQGEEFELRTKEEWEKSKKTKKTKKRKSTNDL